uniref:CCHC-type domain-containing protein n=1 Tax=Globodera pallida TaxID=36090 RepID=A0A183CTM7_GLOPA
PAQGKSAGFVTREIKDKRRTAGQCIKCGGNHKFEDCKTGWRVDSPQKTFGKAGTIEEVMETPQESGKA